MKRVAVVGLNDSIRIFSVVGVEVFVVSTKKEALSLLKTLDHDGFALIFVTKSLCELIPKTIKKHDLGFMPLITQIPG